MRAVFRFEVPVFRFPSLTEDNDHERQEGPSRPPSSTPPREPAPTPRDWISREEARILLGVQEVELRELTVGWELSERRVSLYLKAEVLALAKSVNTVR